ncbi:MAG: MBOAT family protein [Planctomycetes bacterium]|nr:MBOAT family protein [Planctomycetota bacterium]
MVFSTATFLFAFLPIVLLLYFAVPRRWRNGWLLFASLFFYAWGETWIVAVMLASILVNWALALLLDDGRPRRKWGVALSVVFNLGLLVAFKYANFLVDNLNPVLVAAGMPAMAIPVISLPIGISFFTFQALSYVIDVYRGQARVQRNPLDFALYIALFPQLIAGPIVRYVDVAEQIESRTCSADLFADGVRRFVFGLAKKMLIANTVASVADRIFALPNEELTLGLSWLATVCYSLQIYFDFSGYSDMAIGLGLMFGFRYLENFAYPYAADSITKFWRRWHMSLSTWFRDYVYIPLGGNRGSRIATYRNLVIVFFLCGLWHGASWTFVLWGIYHGAFLVFERLGAGRIVHDAPRALRHAYTLFVVACGWVLFRATSIDQALEFYGAMLGFGAGNGIAHEAGAYLDSEVILTILLGGVAAMPVLPSIGQWAQRVLDRNEAVPSVTGVLAVSAMRGLLLCILAVLFVACATKLAASTYNPFIYFRF